MNKIIRLPAFPVGGEGDRLSGFVQVGVAPNGDVVLDAQLVPEGATVVSEGRPWERYSRPALGDLADLVLEAVWEQGKGPNKERVRGKITDGLAHAPFMDTDLVPHVWLGESPEEPVEEEL